MEYKVQKLREMLESGTYVESVNAGQGYRLDNTQPRFVLICNEDDPDTSR